VTPRQIRNGLGCGLFFAAAIAWFAMGFAAVVGAAMFIIAAVFAVLTFLSEPKV